MAPVSSDSPSTATPDLRPGPGFVVGTIEVARQTFLLQLQSRLLWLLLLGELGLSAIAWVIGGHVSDRVEGRNLFASITYWFVLGVLAPWASMYFAVQAVHGDIEDRTFQYLFLRPVSRGALLLGKWLATSCLCSVVLGLGVGLVFAALALRTDLWHSLGIEWHLTVVFLEGAVAAAVAYAAVGAFLAARFRRPLVWSAFFIVGLQYVVANLPGQASIRSITVADPLRRLIYLGLDPDPRLARDLWPFERDIHPVIGQPLLNLAIITLTCVLLALWCYCRSEYDSRPRD